MRIGILGWDHGDEDPDSANLTTHGRELGHETHLFTLEEIGYVPGEGRVDLLLGGRPARDFDAVISRANLYGEWRQNLYDGWPDRVERLTMLSNVPGLPLFDPVDVWFAGYSKFRNAQILTAAGVPTPPVRSAVNLDEVAVAVAEWGRAIVKPSFGLRGIDVELVDDVDRQQAAITDLFARYGTLACQPFVPTQYGEFRVTVAGEVAPICMLKLPAAGSWRCKTLEGASFERWEPSDELRDLAFRATRAMGMTMAGLDILPTEDGGYTVLEVNPVGGFLDIFGPEAHRAALTGVYDWVAAHAG